MNPETVECATCGAVAKLAAWGSTDVDCYRCTECHAGGHIAFSENGTEVRQGGVFKPLRNYATRRARV